MTISTCNKNRLAAEWVQCLTFMQIKSTFFFTELIINVIEPIEVKENHNLKKKILEMAGKNTIFDTQNYHPLHNKFQVSTLVSIELIVKIINQNKNQSHSLNRIFTTNFTKNCYLINSGYLLT